jgi:hypothetical protein
VDVLSVLKQPRATTFRRSHSSRTKSSCCTALAPTARSQPHVSSECPARPRSVLDRIKMRARGHLSP